MGAEPQAVVNGRFLTRRMTGVDRYALEILRCLGSRVRIVRPGGKLGGIAGHAWEQFILPGRVPQNSVLWSPANTGPLAVANQALTICDLSPLEHSEWFKPAFAAWYQLFLPRLARKVKRILAPSEYTRQKILARFGLPEERVKVVPGGVDPARFCRQKNIPGSFGRYLLYVGSLEPRKNLPALLAAWRQIKHMHPDLSLVLVGINGRVFRPIQLDAGAERVIFAGYVPDEKLPALYAGAEVFILPSWDEGFGLPVLEAMACETPVIVSTGGALPEVAGNAALFFEPGDPPALAAAIQRCLNDPDLSQFLRDQGLKRIRHFSWAFAAEAAWQALREAYEA